MQTLMKPLLQKNMSMEIDLSIFEFCKLFGQHGTPEYGHGVLDFPDF